MSTTILRPVVPEYRMRMRRYANKDQRHMNKSFASFFDDEVDNHDGFRIGSRNYVVLGNAADMDCEIAVSCLLRASYSVARIELADLVVAASGGYDDDDIFYTHLEAAQCCFIFGLFDADLVAHLGAVRLVIAQFVMRLVDDKVSVVIPVPDDRDADVDLGLYGVRFADLLADQFSVYKYGE